MVIEISSLNLHKSFSTVINYGFNEFLFIMLNRN